MKRVVEIIISVLVLLGLGCRKPSHEIKWGAEQHTQSGPLALSVCIETLELQPGDTCLIQATVRSPANHASPVVSLAVPNLSLVSRHSLPATLEGAHIQRRVRWLVQALGPLTGSPGTVTADRLELALPPISVPAVATRAPLALPPQLTRSGELCQ